MNHDTCPAITTHATMPHAAIARLCRAIDAAFDDCAHADDPARCAAFATGVRAALAEAAADRALLSPAQRESAADCYRRHLLAADPQGRYAVAALVWRPGQASPVHAHQTWCGYAVVAGTLAETVYAWDADTQRAIETRTQLRQPGAVSFTRAGHTGIHRLGHAHFIDHGPGDIDDFDDVPPAISLHLYGINGTRIATHVNDIVHTADVCVATRATPQTVIA